MDEPGMVSMFQALVASRLQGLLGCTAVVYEEALVEFFANGRVRDGLVVSSVSGVLVEISEELFAETFELHVDGLGDLYEMPKDVLFAETFELHVDGLGDLYEMPKDVVFDARIIVSLSGEPISLSGRKNQMKFEFRLLCDIMAKAISVKAGSFNAITVEKFSLMTAVVCSVRMNWAKFLFSILKKMVTPGSKQAKGFAIQISLLLATIPTLELDGAEEITGAAKQRVASKKRPAADVGAAVPKKKMTIKKKSVSSFSTLEMVAVAQEAVPIQQVAEPSAVEEIRCPSADDVDLIIQQVLYETREVEAPADTAQPAVAEEKHWFDLPYEDLVAKWEAERPVVTASDTDEDIATMDVAPADGDQQVQESVAPISNDDMLSADERMSLDDILLTIPVDIPLPSSSMEITQIMMGKSIKIPGLSELVDYIHRGSADKKGESGSRGLQQPANIQIEGSAVTPTFDQRVEMAQRRIVHTVLDADANRALFARQDAAERDRERRRRESRALKRRRRDYCRTLQEIALSIYSGISAVGVFVRIQQMVCDQQLNGLSSSADKFIKSNQQMLLSRSAGSSGSQAGQSSGTAGRPPFP
ncbi:eukaryotic translation initiation factor 4G-like [Dorcoceras hygrometricum]|uniref:Eukaryotic translation initiation factor 4G-like n=1 Tax=Dorcoceras hygrometricum TaxID=472368 RepID=A0A2Z7DCM3_9LAMI|nr:eukaryotic translation initiation factor 4G-like [Dorcoceras hygrometricum]